MVGETANLLALALQVRLIDLFHLTDDRTPYALWRFVSPRDRRSSREWRKHRALTGLTTKAFHPGRAIRVEGFTEDEEVWAGLQDLRRYCEAQIAQTLDLSARHVPQRYGLDFIKLDWDLTTGSLRPVDFSFGFERRAMFRILSEDIYDGEREVFLRELLQNAIDAIRTRRARHAQRARGQSGKRRPAGPAFDTTIYFTAEHRENGDCLVTCRDEGIGMDEHIVRNYFTVAGVSYYRSPEFERQGLGFEPISRFGIGILSCFMVADSLRVRTYATRTAPRPWPRRTSSSQAPTPTGRDGWTSGSRRWTASSSSRTAGTTSRSGPRSNCWRSPGRPGSPLAETRRETTRTGPSHRARPTDFSAPSRSPSTCARSRASWSSPSMSPRPGPTRRRPGRP